MKALIVATLLVATVPAMAQQYNFGPPAKTIKLYDKDKTTQIATATISRWGIFFRDLDGNHFATIARNPDNTIGAWDQHGKPLDPTVLPLLPAIK